MKDLTRTEILDEVDELHYKIDKVSKILGQFPEGVRIETLARKAEVFIDELHWIVISQKAKFVISDDGKLTVKPRMPSFRSKTEMVRPAPYKPRPHGMLKNDQCIATWTTLRRRINLMKVRGDLSSRHILLVGDDDLMSIGLALSGYEGRIVVLDIDNELVEHIRSISQELGLKIEPDVYDVRNPLAHQYRHAFDLVHTDPPYTVSGISTFLSRSREALVEEGRSVCYISYSAMDLSRSNIMSIQESFHALGFIVTDAQSSFNSYYSRVDFREVEQGCGLSLRKPWFSSSFFRLEVAQDSRPNAVKDRMQDDIYAYPT